TIAPEPYNLGHRPEEHRRRARVSSTLARFELADERVRLIFDGVERLARVRFGVFEKLFGARAARRAFDLPLHLVEHPHKLGREVLAHLVVALAAAFGFRDHRLLRPLCEPFDRAEFALRFFLRLELEARRTQG